MATFYGSSSANILNCIRANTRIPPYYLQHRRHHYPTAHLPKNRNSFHRTPLDPSKTNRTNTTTTTPKKKHGDGKKSGGISSTPAAISTSKSLFPNPVAWYSKKLESHPLTTKCLSSGFITGSGDLTCQYIVAQQRQLLRKQNSKVTTTEITTDRNEQSDDSIDENYNFKPDLLRTGRFVLLGSVLIGPTVHHWYGALMRYIPGSSIDAVLKRTFFDQALFSSLFQPTFLTSLLLLERYGILAKRPVVGVEDEEEEEDISSVLIRTVPDVIVSGWMLWVPAMMINFKYVPGKWQVLYSNGVGFVWNVYLSWKTQEGE